MNNVINILKERKINYFDIIYNKNIVIKDCVLEEIEETKTVNEPSVHILEKKNGTYYTLLMIDLDAPYGYLNSQDFIPLSNEMSYGCTIDSYNNSFGCVPNSKSGNFGSIIINKEDDIKIKYKNDSRNKLFLHWWVTNIVYENDKLKLAEEWVPYTPPQPPYGKHRYYFYLIEQTGFIKRNPLEIPDLISNKFRVPFNYDLWKNKFNWKLIQCKGFIIDSQNVE